MTSNFNESTHTLFLGFFSPLAGGVNTVTVTFPSIIPEN
eukprot:Gb_20785 [translate_table: standard]